MLEVGITIGVLAVGYWRKKRSGEVGQKETHEA
jgi:hypothetical protein